MVSKLAGFTTQLLAILFGVLISVACSRAEHDTISLFPLDNYDQTISHWIKSSDPDYDRPLLSKAQQAQRFAEFYQHYFATTADASSPWSPAYIQQVLHRLPPDDLSTLEKSLTEKFNNQRQDPANRGYGENFHPYSAAWIKAIAANMNLAQFELPLSYHPANRAITTGNLLARVLPTDDPYFHSYKQAGQGYPFDNLQMSAVWVGTPVYILGESKDHVWLLIVAPGFIGWVKSNGIACVSDQFVATWQAAAKPSLAAIIRTATPINTIQTHHHFPAYVGTVLPVAQQHGDTLRLMIPVRGKAEQAAIDYAAVAAQDAVLMPWPVTPHHIAQVMAALQGRPYGWGNSYFYNDCSAELKSLYTPFAIWLPRHSSDQVQQGVMVDKSADSMPQRLHYLVQQGHKLMTIVYIGGHVMLYLGNYPNPRAPNGPPLAMTYQNVWGLSPAGGQRRAVIGQAVLFPLLEKYPEDTTLRSLAAKSYFQVAYLDQIPTPAIHKIELRLLVYPAPTSVY